MQKRARSRTRRRTGMRYFPLALPAVAVALAACGSPDTASTRATLATTHTVEDSGLLDVLTQEFAATYPGLTLRVVVMGSGEALAFGRRGDADLLLTHAPEDEARFVEEGYGVDRRPLMRNEFVLYGPAADPAGIRGTADIAEAFRRVMAQRAPFISRGDDSGTHKRERSIWTALGADPAGAWYIEAGVGQADALRIASERQAYMLADRATFAVLAPTLDIVPLSEGDPRLVNTYSVLRVARAAHPEVASTVADWLTGPAVAALIRGLGTDADGRPLFEPLALPAGAIAPRAPGVRPGWTTEATASIPAVAWKETPTATLPPETASRLPAS